MVNAILLEVDGRVTGVTELELPLATAKELPGASRQERRSLPPRSVCLGHNGEYLVLLRQYRPGVQEYSLCTPASRTFNSS